MPRFLCAADALPTAYWCSLPDAVILPGLDGGLVGQVTMPAMRARLLLGEAP